LLDCVFASVSLKVKGHSHWSTSWRMLLTQDGGKIRNWTVVDSASVCVYFVRVCKLPTCFWLCGFDVFFLHSTLQLEFSWSGYSEVPRRQPHHRSGLANLSSVGAVP